MSATAPEVLTMNNPIVSICVPTFNRAIGLDKLLQNFAEIKKVHGSAVEICISNNHSTDETEDVIKRWQDQLELRVVTQAENIGATKNSFAVSGIASGKWIMLVGDDDGFITENFTQLMDRLNTANEADWILAGVADSSGREAYLGPLKDGRYDSKSIRSSVLYTGLYCYGFIGMHLYPAALKQEFIKFSLEQAQPWPHLALFLRHIQDGHVEVFSDPVVQQARGGAMLFWNIYDMAHIKLRKLNIISEARLSVKKHQWFYDALILRELYLARDIRTLLFWKVLESEDFNRRALREYSARYTLLRTPYVLLVLMHSIILLATYITPMPVLRWLLCLIGQRKDLDTYREKKQGLGSFDGIKRGI